MDWRAFLNTTVAAAASLLLMGSAHAQAVPKAKNVVLVHGLFADGSCWSEVIPRLQAAGLNVISVQNPLTTLPEAVASALQVLARQDRPTVLAGHSFSGMIVTEAGCIRTFRQLSMWLRERQMLAKVTRPWPGVSDATCVGGHQFDGDEGRLGEEAFLRNFAGDLPDRRQGRSTPSSGRSIRSSSPAEPRTRHGGRSQAGMPYPQRIGRSTPSRTLHGETHGRETIEVKASHVSLISQPDTIANLILEAAGQK